MAFQGEMVKGEERLEKYYITKISVKEYSGTNKVLQICTAGFEKTFSSLDRGRNVV
jgi:hypothetical protein